MVDDNAQARQIFTTMLRNMSFKVSQAKSGQEGISVLKRADSENPFDLVVMD